SIEQEGTEGSCRKPAMASHRKPVLASHRNSWWPALYEEQLTLADNGKVKVLTQNNKHNPAKRHVY
ncbi:7556_t:CDS:2, partial [Dentiscutata erythropus]